MLSVCRLRRVIVSMFVGMVVMSVSVLKLLTGSSVKDFENLAVRREKQADAHTTVLFSSEINC